VAARYGVSFEKYPEGQGVYLKPVDEAKHA
jgi:hypothetical protein